MVNAPKEDLLLHFCLGETLQSSEYRRLVPGHLRAPSETSSYEKEKEGNEK